MIKKNYLLGGGMNDTRIIELLEKGWRLEKWTIDNMLIINAMLNEKYKKLSEEFHEKRAIADKAYELAFNGLPITQQAILTYVYALNDLTEITKKIKVYISQQEGRGLNP